MKKKKKVAGRHQVCSDVEEVGCATDGEEGFEPVRGLKV